MQQGAAVVQAPCEIVWTLSKHEAFNHIGQSIRIHSGNVFDIVERIIRTVVDNHLSEFFVHSWKVHDFFEIGVIQIHNRTAWRTNFFVIEFIMLVIVVGFIYFSWLSLIAFENRFVLIRIRF